ncbi:hypothetical protein AVEN_29093-1 [Araneus ventricosus]|uniref:Uncharacterized protein n=1 Tax=Araneus ventricosus TaxID=182803 RepID=A0A4Y2ALE5_ARAVE|nr:hypothetical protein AVEN_29093-1 [Araneus ventricosus]
MTGNYLDVIIDNKPIRAPEDSGASFSVFSDKYSRYLKKVMFSDAKNVILKVANGSFVWPIGKCILRVIIESRELQFEFAVLQNCSHDVILEWDFLEASQAVIDCGRSELFFEDVCQELSVLEAWKLYAIKQWSPTPGPRTGTGPWIKWYRTAQGTLNCFHFYKLLFNLSVFLQIL